MADPLPPSPSPSPWEPTINAVTHILTSPTTNPPLHSQFFISQQIPCYLNWDYPPILCRRSPSLLRRWGLTLFLRRVTGLSPPQTSWRCKCPYQQPPPLTLARGLEEAQWDDEEMKERFRKRARRKRMFSNIHPIFPVMIPNLCAFLLLLWNPFPDVVDGPKFLRRR
ncbi:hypothetical protein LINGRAHAP2_LOCUS5549 [Linum grandiflorum]